ncbi:putative acyl-CoA thioester hydrolase [Methylobrevis pamukkalensis]|uniref:Putative acyl-CoA thioester hydrolase n=1 Tax=Methylobrevis pamukkalensis TaxID=1439726 RepID=A0A1E3H4T2_9HYPH|nr:putative acyl-CoA thioester hydrolase [Methylobrevis pamukkalensis]
MWPRAGAMAGAIMADSQDVAVQACEPSGTPVIRTIAMPADTNPAGDIFGGWLMAHMDLAAGNVATRRARGRAATVAVDAMTFLSPVLVGDEVSFFGEIVATGRSSMRIRIEAWRGRARRRR